MNQLATVLLSVLGVAFIYMGYQLFCGLPALNASGRPATRARLLLLNVIPGALFALAGTALLTNQAKAMMPHNSGVQRYRPETQGTSWHPRSVVAPGRAV
jgi:hypothetical protein